MRTTNAVPRRKKHRKIIKQAKGMQHARRSGYRAAKQGITRSLQYAYRDRRNRKRDFRRLWIIRINAAARMHGMSYSVFMNGIIKAGVEVDRKMLAEIAVSEPKAFAELVKLTQKQS